jgi:hypothetical protein
MMIMENTRPTMGETASTMTYWNQDSTLYRMIRIVSVAEYIAPDSMTSNIIGRKLVSAYRILSRLMTQIRYATIEVQMILVARVREKNDTIHFCNSIAKISALGTTRANEYKMPMPAAVLPSSRRRGNAMT